MLEIELAIIDLDYTLVYPNGTHSALVVETAKSFGYSNLDRVRRVFSETRGISYEQMLEIIHDSCGGQSVLNCSVQEFIERLNKIADLVTRGQRSLGCEPLLVEGATELVNSIKRRAVDYMICTGSLRSIAKLEIVLSGLNEFIALDRLSCSDDTEWDKSQQQYWNHVFGAERLKRAVGFEDRPGAASWLLAAGVSHVFLRSDPQDDYYEAEAIEELLMRYEERVTLVNSWLDITDGLPVEARST